MSRKAYDQNCARCAAERDMRAAKKARDPVKASVIFLGRPCPPDPIRKVGKLSPTRVREKMRADWTCHERRRL